MNSSSDRRRAARRARRLPLAGLVLLAASAPARSDPPEAPREVPRETDTLAYRVVAAYPHDPAAFTQGLVYEAGVLYESTGLYGRSSLRRVDLATGTVLKRLSLPARYFAEGLTAHEGRLLLLTWRARKVFVFRADSFAALGQFAYDTEGWGLTDDGRRLIMSDGTATLRFLDPGSFRVLRRVEARDHAGPVRRLNELEYVRGQIYANVWRSDRVARISPETGEVTGWLDLGGLLPDSDRRPETGVLNGIAYDAARDRLLVTGKRWPKLFAIEVLERDR